MKLLRPGIIRNPMLILLLTAGVAAIVFGATGPMGSAFADAADIRITELRCNEDPEVVAITNQGTTGQDLTGWTLRSDPPATEVYDMSTIGTLAPGETLFVQSGPSAGGFFVWSSSMIFRDGPPSDYARILDSNGALVHEVSCTGASPAPTATPAATPSSSPTPSAGAIIDGGGAPGASNGLTGLAPLLTMAIGAVLIAMGGISLVGMQPRRVSAGTGTGALDRVDGTRDSQAVGMRETLFILASGGLLIAVIKLIAARRR